MSMIVVGRGSGLEKDRRQLGESLQRGETGKKEERYDELSPKTNKQTVKAWTNKTLILSFCDLVI